MARTVRSAEHLHRLRDELVDRLLRAPDEEAARELARAERVPHDAQVQVDAPARRGGWALSGGMIPVEPMRRHEHYLETEHDANPSAVREGRRRPGDARAPRRVSVGKVDFDHPGGEDFTVDATDYTDRVAPAMAERFAGLGRLTLRDSWTGLYDQNRFDGNMILGNWPGQLDNFYVACGFSGHGFMHALAVGRGLAELITSGGYQTLDLSRMGYQRVLDDKPYGEEGVR